MARSTRARVLERMTPRWAVVPWDAYANWGRQAPTSRRFRQGDRSYPQAVADVVRTDPPWSGHRAAVLVGTVVALAIVAAVVIHTQTVDRGPGGVYRIRLADQLNLYANPDVHPEHEPRCGDGPDRGRGHVGDGGAGRRSRGRRRRSAPPLLRAERGGCRVPRSGRPRRHPRVGRPHRRPWFAAAPRPERVGHVLLAGYALAAGAYFWSYRDLLQRSPRALRLLGVAVATSVAREHVRCGDQRATPDRQQLAAGRGVGGVAARLLVSDRSPGDRAAPMTVLDPHGELRTSINDRGHRGREPRSARARLGRPRIGGGTSLRRSCSRGGSNPMRTGQTTHASWSSSTLESSSEGSRSASTGSSGSVAYACSARARSHPTTSISLLPPAVGRRSSRRSRGGSSREPTFADLHGLAEEAVLLNALPVAAAGDGHLSGAVRPPATGRRAPRSSRSTAVRNRDGTLGGWSARGAATASWVAATRATSSARCRTSGPAMWSGWGEGSGLGSRLSRCSPGRCRPAPAVGAVRIHELRVDDEVVASELTLDVAGRRHRYQSGRSTEHQWRGAGGAVTMHVVEGAQAEGYVEVDFLRGREPYKYDWTETERDVVRARASHGLAPRVVLRALGLASERGPPRVPSRRRSASGALVHLCEPLDPGVDPVVPTGSLLRRPGPDRPRARFEAVDHRVGECVGDRPPAPPRLRAR